MNEIETALHALCDELSLTPPAPDSRGRYELHADDLVIRLAPWGKAEAVLEGIVANMGNNSARSWENQQDLLRQVLTWNIARLKGQARPETLSFDEDENQLLLWRTWPVDSRLTGNILRGAEEMLNELEFWRGKILSVAPSLGQKGSL